MTLSRLPQFADQPEADQDVLEPDRARMPRRRPAHAAALNRAFDLMHAGESIRSVVVYRGEELATERAEGYVIFLGFFDTDRERWGCSALS